MAKKLLAQDFYIRDTVEVARRLLGQVLCCRFGDDETRRFRIVETEAYLGLGDPACHSYHGKRTERVRPLYLDGGHSYVYLIYGIYHCLNVVTGDASTPEAVLIRALEPLGSEGRHRAALKKMETNGPGKLCRALGITREHNGRALFKKSSGLWIEEGEAPESIVPAKRVGIEGYGEPCVSWPLRFYEAGNPYVSR